MEIKQKKSIPSFLKKYGWILLLIILVTVVLVIKTIPNVNATVVTDKEWITKWENFLNGFGVTIFENMAKGYETLNNFLDPSFEEGKYNAAQSVQVFITGLAHVFVVLFMLIGIIKEGSRGEVDVDMIYWFRIFANTAIAVIMVTSISTIMNGLYGLGNFMVTSIAGSQIEEVTKVNMGDLAEGKTESKLRTPDFTGTKSEVLVAIVKNIPCFEYLGTVVEEGAGASGENYLPEQNLVDYLNMFMYVAYLPMLVALFLMYSAIFELKIRQILAPLAVSTISFEGARGSGVRFLKKYLACFLKIVIYFLVAWIGYSLSMYFYDSIMGKKNIDTSHNAEKGSADLSADGVIEVIMMLMSNVVCAMAMMQTGGIADEVVGS